MARGRPKRKRAREAAVHAGKVFREVAHGASSELRAQMAEHLGGNQNVIAREKIRATNPATRARQMRLSSEAKAAVKNLDRLFREKKGKMPVDRLLRDGSRLIDLKNEILSHILNPQGEIQITSFEEMRKFLKDKGICLNEGEFQRIVKDLFNAQEANYISQIFPQRNQKGTPRTITETRFNWFEQAKKAA